jgi:hypothetical protein
MRPLVVLLLAFTLQTPLLAQRGSGDPATLYSQALTARNQKNFELAISLLRKAVGAQPDRVEYRLALGETLGWMNRFEEAAAVYRETIRKFPQSTSAKTGLGQVLLWKGDYGEARTAFEAALKENPASRDAREGLATVAYWTGDYRTARREFQRIRASDPSHREAAKIIEEIDQAIAPSFGIGSLFRTDDQPYRMLRSEAAIALFSDPGTKWTVSGGGYALENRDSGGDATVPFGELAVESKLPGGRLDIHARARYIQFPDDESAVLPAVSLSRGFGQAGRVTLFFDESELLFSERALDSHPSVETVGLRWSREEDADGWTAAASTRSLRYFDDNSGISTDAWILFPFRTSERLRISAGTAVSWRDTDESRFRAVPGTSEGVYDPYWTPQELIEGRGVVAISWQARRIDLHFHGDAGFAQDEAIDLSSGMTFSRTFHPWSVSLSGRTSIGPRLELTTQLKRESTAFYEANEIQASLAGRF